MTPEDDAEEREFLERFRKIEKCRLAITFHLGGTWKKGMPTAAGRIDCPACGGVKTLSFRRAGYNGHIHAHCSTAGCVNWME